MSTSNPIPYSYWVVPGLLLAGEYPAARTEARTKARLAAFIAAGIRTFVDLTHEADPLEPYSLLLDEVAREAGVECKHVQYAIRDQDVPDDTLMVQILDTIEQETSAGQPVYVHCWGGIGRTGTVVGCWLIEQGLSAEDALARIIDLRRDTPNCTADSPECEGQKLWVLDWGRKRRRNNPAS